MYESKLAQISAFPGWLIGVTYHHGRGHRCWVITPELTVLNDGEWYPSDREAMAAGRYLVELSLESGWDTGRNQPQETD